MKAHVIQDGICCLYADIHTADLFEGIWPIPHGVSLNVYLVKGEKTALIDLASDWTGAAGRIAEELASIGMGYGAIDYLVLNHLEPDHTGWLKEFRRENPGAEIISTRKGIDLVKTFYKIDTGLRAVKDGECLDLGGGKRLVFYETPNIHWPETMMTFEEQSGVLFTCDGFGSFGALGGRVFDDEFDTKEHAFFEEESLRYYANIVCSFSSFVDREIQKISSLNLKVVAPSHGIVWRKEPEKIVERYRTYASWAKGPAEKRIAIIWGSMYGNTKRGLDAVIAGIEAEGTPYSLRRVPDENLSYVLADAWRSSALVLAMPTYEYAMFPPAAYVLDMFRRKHVFNKLVLRIGSWGWVGGAKKEYEAAIESLKWNSIESHEWAGAPAPEDLHILEERGRELARLVKAM